MTHCTYRDRAHQLRADYLASTASMSGRWLRARASAPFAGLASAKHGDKEASIGIKAMAAVALCAVAVLLAVSARAEDNSADDALLAQFGLNAVTIQHSTDKAALWRAARELVVPGRVSVATQQAILRQIWTLDPDTQSADALDIHNHNYRPDEKRPLAGFETGDPDIQ